MSIQTKLYKMKEFTVDDFDKLDLFVPREIEQVEILDSYNDNFGEDDDMGEDDKITFMVKESAIYSMYNKGSCYYGENKNTKVIDFIFGVSDLLNGCGALWFLSTDNFKPNLQFLKLCKFVVIPLLSIEFDSLTNFIHRDNEVSLKWLRWLNFTFEDHPLKNDFLQFYKYVS